jgi:hypothetical protein
MALKISKRKEILGRIKHLEEAITKGREYLANGKHAGWHGFRPLFVSKARENKVLSPHKDWIKNVFLPNHEKSLVAANSLLERVTSAQEKPAHPSGDRIRRRKRRGSHKL